MRERDDGSRGGSPEYIGRRRGGELAVEGFKEQGFCGTA